MGPLTWVAIAVLVSAGAGFGAGWGLKPDNASKALEAQTDSIKVLNEGNQALVAQVQAAALEAATRETLIAEKLTGIPPQCVPTLGGDPMSAQCAWAFCVRTGETDKQRCEPSKLTDYMIKRMDQAACPEGQ